MCTLLITTHIVTRLIVKQPRRRLAGILAAPSFTAQKGAYSSPHFDTTHYDTIKIFNVS